MADLDQVRIRTAMESDATALRGIDLVTPDVIGDVVVTTDRGEDWFAAIRLMEAPTVLVGEVDGRIVGVLCTARHRARVAGEDRTMVVAHQVRVVPEYQGKGLGIMFIADMASRIPPGDGTFYFLIPRENAATQTFARATFNQWKATPYAVSLPTEGLGTTAAAKTASEADAARVAAILNRAHEGEEFFLPYTAESFSARVSRSPELYGWKDVLMGDAAVVGIGHVTQQIRRARNGEVVSEEVETRILDHGCDAGGEEELDDLIRRACAVAAERGVTGLCVYASQGARCTSVVDRLGGSKTELDLWTPSLTPPDSAEANGVYVDPIYV